MRVNNDPLGQAHKSTGNVEFILFRKILRIMTRRTDMSENSDDNRLCGSKITLSTVEEMLYALNEI